MRQASQDSFTNSIRYALLTLMFCALNAIELAHAKFALLTLSELHAYWMGQYGHFPFAVLPWSERHFGGGALAIRLPLLAVFAVILAVVLLLLDRMVLCRMSTVMLTVVVVIALFALGIQQVFAFMKLRAEKRTFFALLDRVERAAAPGEAVAAEWNLTMPLYYYGPNDLRQQLHSVSTFASDYPPVKALQQNKTDEVLYVGSAQDKFASSLIQSGYEFHEYQPPLVQENEINAHYYRSLGASIYFVSPPAHDVEPAVSLKP